MDVRFIGRAGVRRHSVDDLPELLARDEGFVWVDIPVCDEADAEVLIGVFGCHPLAVRDCVERNRVPRVRLYPEHAFLILHGAERGDAGHVHYIELDQFIGARYLVTVQGRSTRRSPMPWRNVRPARFWPAWNPAGSTPRPRTRCRTRSCRR